jgi:uncharacterized membrane-anchored protein YitT (DUF2179 family)
MNKKNVLNTLKTYAIITAGCLVYAIAYNWFYAPNALSCGGFTGVGQIINYYLPFLPVGSLMFLLNLPLFIVGLKKYGWAILARTLYAVTLSALFIDLIKAMFDFQPMEPLLACLYGGIIAGVGFGWMLLEEATTGGTELAAYLLKLKLSHLSIGRLCLVLDLVVIVVYAAVFKNLENALYGGITLYVITSVMDLIVYGGNKAKLAYIISKEQEEITKKLIEADLGVTALDGNGAYTGEKKKVLLVAVRRRELVMAKRIVKQIDPTAFIIMCDASEVLGEGFGEYKQNGL